MKLYDILVSVFTKRRGPPPEFQWLHKYALGAGNLSSSGSGSSWSGMDTTSGDKVGPDDDGHTGQDESLTDAVSVYNSFMQIMIVLNNKTVSDFECTL